MVAPGCPVQCAGPVTGAACRLACACPARCWCAGCPAAGGGAAAHLDANIDGWRVEGLKHDLQRQAAQPAPPACQGRSISCTVAGCMYACLGLDAGSMHQGRAQAVAAAAMVPTAHCSSGRDARPKHSPNPTNQPLSTLEATRGVYMLMVRHALPVEAAGACCQLLQGRARAAPQLQVCPSAAALAHLGHALPVGLGVEGRLGQQHWVLLWSTAACKLLKAVKCVCCGGWEQRHRTQQQPTSQAHGAAAWHTTWASQRTGPALTSGATRSSL